MVIPRLYNGRGRTFWFVSGETVNGSAASADLNPTVPIEPWRRGDFSALGRPIRNPFTGEVYADGRIPAAALNPVSLRIQERFYPLPNTGNTATLRGEQLPRDAAGRIDRNRTTPPRASITTSARPIALFGRFTFHEATNPVWEGNLPAFGMRNQRRMNKAVHGLVYAHSRPDARQRVPRRSRVQQQSDRRSAQRPRGHRLARPQRSRARAARRQRGPEGQLPGQRPHRACRRSTGRNPGLPQPEQSGPEPDDVAARHAQLQGRRRGPACRLGGAQRPGEPLRQRRLHGPVHGGPGRRGAAAIRMPTSCSACPTPPRARFRRSPRCGRAGPTTSSRRTTGRSRGTSPSTSGCATTCIPAGTSATTGWPIFDLTSGKIVIPDGRPRQGVAAHAGGLRRRRHRRAASACRRATLVRTDRNNIAPRIGFAYRPVRRREHGPARRLRPLLRHDADRSVGVPDALRLPGDRPSPIRRCRPWCFRPCFRRPARRGRRPSRCRSRSIRICSFRTATSGTRRSSTSGGGPASACRTWPPWDARCGSRATSTRRKPTDRLYVDKPRPFPRYPNINYVDNGATHDYHGVTHRSRAPDLEGSVLPGGVYGRERRT